MTFDVHPFVVHFPIALLVVYSIIKILPLKRWFPKVEWRQIERALLVVGVIAAFVALGTGENAERLARPEHRLVETHSFFAGFATWLYGALLFGEILSVLNPIFFIKFTTTRLLRITITLERVLTHRLFSTLIVVVALMAMLVTGLLGGVMVYGTTADPFAGIVLKLLGL